MSPAGSSQAEEQQYLDKLKQLSKYIEPLRRMINKIDKNEDRKKDLSKMKSLLDILTDPSKRCPLKTLQKCEIALEKLKNDMAVVSGDHGPTLLGGAYGQGSGLLEQDLAEDCGKKSLRAVRPQHVDGSTRMGVRLRVSEWGWESIWDWLPLCALHCQGRGSRQSLRSRGVEDPEVQQTLRMEEVPSPHH